MNFLKNKNILIVSPEDWSHIFVSKHHYAAYLARYNNVVFLNRPSSGFRVLKSDFANLSIAEYTGFVKGLRFFPKFTRKLILSRMYKKLEKLTGLSFDIVWSFDNSVFFDFDLLPNNPITISHIVDINQNFQTGRSARSADICLGVIPEIVNRMLQYNQKTYLVRHGVNTTFVSNATYQLPGKKKSKALYVGNLKMPHINWPLLLQAVSHLKDTDFVFLGSNPESAQFSVLSKNDNVHYLPPIPATEIQGYLKSADILLLAYTKDYYTQYASPHKLMEYFLSGNPIVTSYCEDYNYVSELIYMAKNDSDWLLQLDMALKEGKHSSQRGKRIDYAFENSYSEQLKKIDKILSDNLLP